MLPPAPQHAWPTNWVDCTAPASLASSVVPPPPCLGLLQLPPVSRCRRRVAPASLLFSSFPSPACSDVMGSSKPAMAGVFIPWKLASTPHQGLFSSFREPVYQNATGLTDLDGFVRERGRRGGGARGYQHRRIRVSLTQDIRGGGCSWTRSSPCPSRERWNS